MFLFYILYNVLSTRFYRCPWYPDGFYQCYPCLWWWSPHTRMYSNLLAQSSEIFANQISQAYFYLTPLFRSGPQKKLFSLCRLTFFKRFFNCLLLSNIRSSTSRSSVSSLTFLVSLSANFSAFLVLDCTGCNLSNSVILAQNPRIPILCKWIRLRITLFTHK